MDPVRLGLLIGFLGGLALGVSLSWLALMVVAAQLRIRKP